MKKGLTKEEDEKIIALHVEYNDDWPKIANEFPGRSAKEIHARYHLYLSHIKESTEWTEAESQLVIEYFTKFGTKWKLYSKFFPNKSLNSIRNKAMEKNKVIEDNKVIEKNKIMEENKVMEENEVMEEDDVMGEIAIEEKDLDDVIPFR